MLEHDLLTEAIARAGASFARNELAYLSLTSKVERPFMDRVAFALHETLSSRGVLVAREFHLAAHKHADIAVIENSDVTCFLEGKAMVVADCVRPEPTRRQYALKLQRDLNRYANARASQAAIYCLLLGVHPLEKIPANLGHVVKYSRLLNAAFGWFPSAAETYSAADRNLRGYLRKDVGLQAGAVPAGEAFGVPVEVRWWQLGPFRAPDNLRVLRA